MDAGREVDRLFVIARERRTERGTALLDRSRYGRRRGAEAGLCGSCMDARAIREEHLLEGARRSSLEELTEWTLWADKVISF